MGSGVDKADRYLESRIEPTAPLPYPPTQLTLCIRRCGSSKLTGLKAANRRCNPSQETIMVGYRGRARDSLSSGKTGTSGAIPSFNLVERFTKGLGSTVYEPLRDPA